MALWACAGGPCDEAGHVHHNVVYAEIQGKVFLQRARPIHFYIKVYLCKAPWACANGP